MGSEGLAWLSMRRGAIFRTCLRKERCGASSLTLQFEFDFCSLDIHVRAIVPRHFPLYSRNDDCDGQECMLIRERLTTALKEMDALAGILEGEVHDMENDR